MSKVTKYVSISTLEQGDPRAPIWALNGAADSDIGQPGEVHVGIPKINGTKVDDLYLPQTWLPINLTDQIPRAQLLAASEFRNSVTNKLIVLITNQYAEAIMAQDGATEERARLDQMRRAVRDALGARSIQQSGAEISTPDGAPLDQPAAPAKKELSATFVMFANNLENKPDVEALNAIRSRGKFSNKELSYMAKKLVGKTKVLAFIEERRAARKAAKAAKA